MSLRICRGAADFFIPEKRTAIVNNPVRLATLRLEYSASKIQELPNQQSSTL